MSATQERLAAALVGPWQSQGCRAHVGTVASVSGHTAMCLLGGDDSSLTPVRIIGGGTPSVGSKLLVLGQGGRYVAPLTDAQERPADAITARMGADATLQAGVQTPLHLSSATTEGDALSLSGGSIAVGRDGAVTASLHVRFLQAEGSTVQAWLRQSRGGATVGDMPVSDCTVARSPHSVSAPPALIKVMAGDLLTLHAADWGASCTVGANTTFATVTYV